MSTRSEPDPEAVSRRVADEQRTLHRHVPRNHAQHSIDRSINNQLAHPSTPFNRDRDN